MHKLIAAVAVMLLPFAHAAKQPSLAELFKRVNPAVPVLHTIERQAVATNPTGEVSFEGLGSGVLIDTEGHVVTAAHVVHSADAVTAEFPDGQRITAVVVASDPTVDLALLKLDLPPAGIRPVKLADSSDLQVGEDIFVVGAPYGIGHTLTRGIVSGRHTDGPKAMGMAQTEVIQTDAAINQGNSGGPMFNLRGEVVGIVSYILSKSGGFEGLGFAVASNTVRYSLFENPMFWSGMTGILLSGEVADAFNVPQDYGYLVQKVARDSPSDRLGLRAGRVPAQILDRTLLIGGDVLLAVDGVELTPGNVEAIRARMAQVEEGQLYRVTVLRAGKLVDLTGIR